MSRSGAPEPAEYDEDAEYGGETTSLLSDPTGYIREIVLSVLVGSVLSVVTFAIATGVDIWMSVRSALATAGGAVTGDVGLLWSTAATLVTLPIELSGDLAASAGPFAPLVAALTFAVTAAIAGAIAWSLYRLVVIIT
ncbi:hypothetical protein U4E84_09610 [Halorubrum sp. AD140]|uniref:hypothetical protein n=1 Tax=Halorubrum sp. AD140 TaxID=3050073 RepID=UPI002ACC39EA|nr:hypothetical protein [Halorubrum sp. AD140]MDZ5811599.1 hypothetical protein [Halorubrum sp. AD140]